MGGQHGIDGKYEKTEPVADYHVDGSPLPVPDCTCNYFATGTYNDRPYYRRADGLFFLFWFNLGLVWLISDALGQVSNCFSSNGENIIHTYVPVGTYQGNPVVSTGPH